MLFLLSLIHFSVVGFDSSAAGAKTESSPGSISWFTESPIKNCTIVLPFNYNQSIVAAKQVTATLKENKSQFSKKPVKKSLIGDTPELGDELRRLVKFDTFANFSKQYQLKCSL
jgi:hypothetical protein